MNLALMNLAIEETKRELFALSQEDSVRAALGLEDIHPIHEIALAIEYLEYKAPASVEEMMRLAELKGDLDHDQQAQLIQRSIICIATAMIYPQAIRCFIYKTWDDQRSEGWFDVIYYVDKPIKRIVNKLVTNIGPASDPDHLSILVRMLGNIWTVPEILTGWNNRETLKGLQAKLKERDERS